LNVIIHGVRKKSHKSVTRDLCKLSSEFISELILERNAEARKKRWTENSIIRTILFLMITRTESRRSPTIMTVDASTIIFALLPSLG
jgi:hypothetical protein